MPDILPERKCQSNETGSPLVLSCSAQPGSKSFRKKQTL